MSCLAHRLVEGNRNIVFFGLKSALNELFHVAVGCSAGNVTHLQKDYMHRYMAQELSFDLKPVDPQQFSFFRRLEPSPPKKLFWVKLKGTIGEVHIF